MIKQEFFFFVNYHKGFFYYNVVCQNVLWSIKEQMDIFPQQPRFESRLAEVGDKCLQNTFFSILNCFLRCKIKELFVFNKWIGGSVGRVVRIDVLGSSSE